MYLQNQKTNKQENFIEKNQLMADFSVKSYHHCYNQWNTHIKCKVFPLKIKWNIHWFFVKSDIFIDSQSV